MAQNKLSQLIREFREPLIVSISIILYLLAAVFHLSQLAFLFIIIAIVLGSYKLFIEMLQRIIKGQYALDYIAVLAILVSFFTQEYLVCAIIALMISSGRNLEDYGVSQAKKSLTMLAERIPSSVNLYQNGGPGKKSF